MGMRWLLAFGGVLLVTTGTPAQDRPVELPPLLTPPAGDPGPPPAGPRGPTGEYDHGHLYLPQYVPPDAAPEACRPLGRWWVSPTLELAWVPKNTAPGAVRLRVPDGLGGTLPGPILPVAGVGPPQFQAGFGLVVGRWLGEGNIRGVEASLYTVGADRTFISYAPGMLVVFPNGADASAPQVVVLPPPADVIVGIFPTTFSTWFITADVNYRRNLYCSANARLDALAGYRFAFLDDELYPGDLPDPSEDEHDWNRVAATNPFHGGQIGLAGEFRAGPWYVAGAGKVAFGAVTPQVCATGLFIGAKGATATGSYAHLVSLREQSETQFAVLPALNLTVGRQLGDHARVFAGYSFQYLSRAARLGDVLDPTVTGLPMTQFWVQSVSLGMEFRF